MGTAKVKITKFRDPQNVIETMERFLDSAQRLFEEGRTMDAMAQIRRARAVAYSFTDGGHSIQQTSLWSWRPNFVRRGRLSKYWNGELESPTVDTVQAPGSDSLQENLDNDGYRKNPNSRRTKGKIS